MLWNRRKKTCSHGVVNLSTKSDQSHRHIDSKTEADTEATRIGSQIQAGTFIRAGERLQAVRPAIVGARSLEPMTFFKFATIYVERVSQTRERNKSWKDDRYRLAQIGAFRLADGSCLGDKALDAITEDDLEALMAALRLDGRAVSTRNHYVGIVKKAFRWAKKKGFIARSPVTEDSSLARGKTAQRHRRLTPDVVDEKRRLTEPGEERRLLRLLVPGCSG